MRVLVCGDRNWSNTELLESFLSRINITTLIQGDCSGADKKAKKYAKKKGIECLSFPAEWKKLGNRAGPIRNALMLKEGQPDFVVAFHDNLEESKGTKNMVKQAKDKGLKVILVNKQGEKFV